MSATVAPYPLQWPSGRPRCASRRRAAFNKKSVNRHGWAESQQLSVSDALGRLQSELDRLGARYSVISTNLEPRLDGMPKSGQREPADPGVALYFDLSGKPHCMPCDTFDRVADNIVAIAKHIEATRAIERYGVATMSEMFAGFAALPPPGAKRPWQDVLGITAPAAAIDRSAIESAFRAKARAAHPDAGGSHTAMSELNQARTDALRDIGA